MNPNGVAQLNANNFISLNYPLFTQYVINMDIIEELTYLSTPNGGAVSLDIVPGASRGTSRPGTRGANRGEKEDFKVCKPNK